MEARRARRADPARRFFRRPLHRGVVHHPRMAEVEPMIDASLRESVIALACDAASAILEVYGADFDVERKTDASPLTEADLASHRCIAAGLARLTPDIPVLSEEAEHKVAAEVRREWKRLWIVDPLDGTREFVKRNGEFSVNIALVED